MNSATVQLFSKRRTILSSRIEMRGDNWIWEKAIQRFAMTLCQCIEVIPICRRRGVDIHYTPFSYLSLLGADVVSMIELLIIDNWVCSLSIRGVCACNLKLFEARWQLGLRARIIQCDTGALCAFRVRCS